jgi:hypothetical protein
VFCPPHLKEVIIPDFTTPTKASDDSPMSMVAQLTQLGNAVFELVRRLRVARSAWTLEAAMIGKSLTTLDWTDAKLRIEIGKLIGVFRTHDGQMTQNYSDVL